MRVLFGHARIAARPMCGIAGVLRFDGQPPSLAALRTMSRALAHRGPDGEGHRVLGPCGLAHRRLAIIDLSPAGKQPMSTPDGRLHLTYNGEVYNYLELRRELEQRGHSFFSQSDSEVILEAYRAYGTRAFEKFNGMWGLAIYDAADRKLILSRDRAGVKPLYLHRNAERLLFASEIKALLAAEPSLAVLDRDAAARFVHDAKAAFNRETWFQDVEALEPGSILEVSASGRTARSRYWTFLPPERPLSLSLGEAAERVRELLIDAVRLRFRSDVPVGTCLSGGIDSSSIVSIAGKKLGKAPESFSVLYEDASLSETEFVRIMQRELSLDGREVFPSGDDLPEVLERATYFQESPVPAHGIYSQWQVMKLASRRVKVLLDGQGGDELFGGYFSYFLPHVQSALRRAVRGDPRAFAEILRSRREIKALSGEDTFRTLARRGARELLGRMRGAAGGTGPGRGPSRTPPPRITGDPLADALWDSLIRSSIPGLLHYEDRDSMAFSIEARTPFLDYRLIELAFQLPSAMKMRGATTKLVLREAMKGILPEPIRARLDKKGYPTPFATWTRGAHADWVSGLLVNPRFGQRGLIDVTGVERRLDEHRSGKRDHSGLIHQLITLELFCRRFLDQPFRAEDPPPHAAFDEQESSSKLDPGLIAH